VGGRVPADPATAPGDPAALVPVYLTVAVRTSAGPGPGLKRLPPAEAGRLVGMRHAAYGEQPPRGYEDGGADSRNIALMMPRGMA
jgi:hypothetical protein